MEPFTKVTGIAAALPSANIDTDVIMPKQFLKGVDRSGLDIGLFHDLRFDEQGHERPQFILNQPKWRDAVFLVVGPNFGCGSSREHAVWGLMQYGIRALIGTTFSGIFFDNCARNGLLAISLSEPEIADLVKLAETGAASPMTVDLGNQTVSTGDQKIGFNIDPIRREALLNGRDAIGQTLDSRSEIASFEAMHLRKNPWFSAGLRDRQVPT